MLMESAIHGFASLSRNSYINSNFGQLQKILDVPLYPPKCIGLQILNNFILEEMNKILLAEFKSIHRTRSRQIVSHIFPLLTDYFII